MVFISKYFRKLQYVNAPNIILGIANPLDPNTTNSEVILILKYYLYTCRCFGDKPSINGGTKYLKYCLKIEKISINFLSPTQKEYILVEKRNCALLKNQLKINIKIKFINCLQYIDE